METWAELKKKKTFNQIASEHYTIIQSVHWELRFTYSVYWGVTYWDHINILLAIIKIHITEEVYVCVFGRGEGGGVL